MHHNLTVYHTKANLTKATYDISNVYILPVFIAFGLTANTVLLVSFYFGRRTFKQEKIFAYMVVYSMADLAFLMTQFPIFVMRCGNLCPFGYRKALKLFELYVYLCTGYTLVTFQFLLNISISIDRLVIFFDLRLNKKEFNFYLKCLLFFLLAFVLNMPDYVFSMEVRPFGLLINENDANSSEILYGKTLKEEYTTESVQLVLTIVSILKEPLLIVTLCTLNLVILVKYQRYIKKKRQIVKMSKFTTITTTTPTFTTANRREANVTVMTLILCLSYIFGNLIDCYLLINDIFAISSFGENGYVTFACNCLLYLSHSINFFIYFKFNRCFRSIIKAKLTKFFPFMLYLSTETSHS